MQTLGVKVPSASARRTSRRHGGHDKLFARADKAPSAPRARAWAGGNSEERPLNITKTVSPALIATVTAIVATVTVTIINLRAHFIKILPYLKNYKIANEGIIIDPPRPLEV